MQRLRCIPPSTAMEKIAEVVDLCELFADRARVRGDSGMRARSRRTILKSSSIAKNWLRSSSTWTSGVHWDKESLPNAKSPETELEHVFQSARRDCRVSTIPGARIGAVRRVRRIRLLHHPKEVWSRCTVQLRAHICELCLPTERGNMAADRGQSGHQAHIYELCLPAARGIDMDTGKEVLFALPLVKIIFSLDATGCQCGDAHRSSTLT